MKKTCPILCLVLFGLLIPQAAFAVWWKPSTWQIFNKAPEAKIEPKLSIPSATSTVDSKKNTPTSNPQTKSVVGPTMPVVPVKLTNSQIIKKIKPAVVYIDTEEGSGSGMIISIDGYILTNAHVVSGSVSVQVALADKSMAEGLIIGQDETSDLAIIKINRFNLPSVVLGDSDKVEQGDEVFTLGFPFGIKGDVSFKEGTISRRLEKYLETSAEIHPGNSGGPLVNRYGQVIGVNSASFGSSIRGVQLGETIKLAIPINIAKKIIPELKAGKNIHEVNGNPQRPQEDILSPAPVYSGTSLSISIPKQPFGGSAVLVPRGAVRVAFTRITLTASNDGDVLVRSLVIQNVGSATNSALSGIVLLDENGIQIGKTAPFDSNREIIVEGPFVISRGQSKVITVAGERTSPDNLDNTSGQVVVLTISGINTSAIVLGSLPVKGIENVINNGLVIGSVKITPADKFGGLRLTANSAEDIMLHSIRIPKSVLPNPQNIQVYADGGHYQSSIASNGSYYVVKITNSIIIIEKGITKEIYISDNNTPVDLKSAELYLTGGLYGYDVQAVMPR